MTGRIYDPLSSQSYNRYTYLWNNPTNLTDPTGFVGNDPSKDQDTKPAEEEKKKKGSATAVVMPVASCPPGVTCIKDTQGRLYVFVGTFSNENSSGGKGSKDGTGGNGNSNSSASFWDKVSNFFSQASRSFGAFDVFMPSRSSFASGAEQMWGGPCDHDCAAHNAIANSTTDTMQGAAQVVAEAGNSYYPELAKTGLLSALPLGGAASEYTTLYRAVSRAELESIANLGKFTPSGGSMGNKWFAESAADAAAWGKKFFGFDKEAVFTIRVRVPNDLTSKMMRDPRLDGIGPARSADTKLFDEINRRGRIDALNGSVLK